MKRARLTELLLLAALLLCLMPHAAKAASLGGSGLKNRVEIGSGTYYDPAAGNYIYLMGNAEVGMNVPSGIITNDPVCVYLPSGMTCKIYRDGTLLSGSDPSCIRDAGAYVIVFGEKLGSVDFTIIGAASGNLVRYSLPGGFRIISQKLDGQEIASSGYFADFNKEGSYELRYGCETIQRYYTLQVLVDRTAPTLSFTNLENGHADGPVEIRGRREGDTVTIVRSGKEMPYTDKLTAGGNYTVTVTDAAGNSNTYRFSISVYYSVNVVTFILILAAIAVGLVVYIVIARKRLRIR